MGCSQGLARVFVFITNFAFLLAGIALLVVGILVKLHFTKFTDAIPSDFTVVEQLPYFIIGLGAIIFFISFLGCYGAKKENTCMLALYGAILIVIFVVQVGLAIYGFAVIKDKEQLQTKITTSMEKVFSKYYKDKTAETVVDLIQQQCECCGTYTFLFWTKHFLKAPPASCYPEGKSIPFISGCSNEFPQYVINSLEIIAIAALCISLVEVVGAVLALSLSSCIRQQRRRGPYYQRHH